MKRTNQRQYQAQVFVRDLCNVHRDQLEATPLGKTMVAQLDQSVNRAADGFKVQSDGRIVASQSARLRRKGCNALRTNVKHVVRASEMLPYTSTAGEPFPKVRRSTDQQLVADSKAIRERALPLAEAFTTNGLLPADLLTDLQGQIAVVETAIAAQGAAKETHVGANAATVEAIRQGAIAIRALEPIFFHANAGDPNLISKWKIAKRIGPARKEAAAPPAQPPSATKSA